MRETDQAGPHLTGVQPGFLIVSKFHVHNFRSEVMTQPKISLTGRFMEVTEEARAEILNNLNRLKREYGLSENDLEKLKTSTRKLFVRKQIQEDRYVVEECGDETREDLLEEV